jgi:hypothetical protein
MQGTCEEVFLLRQEGDGADNLLCYDELKVAKGDAHDVTFQVQVQCEVWHLDFKAQKMTLVKVFKPRPKDDEEELVEYV